MSAWGTALAVPAVLLVAGCAEASDAPEAIPVDSAFVDVLVDLHLADARAARAPDSLRRDRVADSLRHVALALHDVDSTTVARRLDALAQTPTVARATYDAVDAVLSEERRGGLPD